MEKKAIIVGAGAVGFADFLFHNRRNRLYLGIAVISILLQFVVFKHFYPFPSFIQGDSYKYLQAASDNANINTLPIGYSKFLRLFNVFSHSDVLLVAIQYFLVQASAIGFAFSLFYFYKPCKFVEIFLIACMTFNPVSLYLANLVSSDALFIALSFIWLTVLLWILQRPTYHLIVWQALVLFLTFTIRYNALYYPFVSALSFLLSRQRVRYILVGTTMGVVFIGAFIVFTSHQYEKLIGEKVFSPFSGWQLANNALYAYRYIDSEDRKLVPAKYWELERMVSTYFDTSRNVFLHPMERLEASTAYMWTPTSPLQQYMYKKYRVKHSKKDSTSSKLQRWAPAGALFGEYGSWIIRQYPLTFVRHYLMPNTIKYYIPPTEFLANYNMGLDTIRPVAQIWFSFKSNKVKTTFGNFTVNSLEFYPILAGIINLLFLCSFFCFFFLKGFTRYCILSRPVLLAGSLWLLNFGFSVFVSPIALRYQIFPLLVFLSITTLLLEYIYNIAFEKNDKKNKEPEGSYQVLAISG